MKKISPRSGLWLSIGFILLMWLRKVVQNTAYSDFVVWLSESLPRFSIYALVNAAVIVLIIVWLLKLSRETFKDIGFDKHNLFKQLRTGFLFGLLIFILNSFIIGPIIEGLWPKAGGIDMSLWFKNLYFLPVLFLLALFKAGFAEELERIFVLTRFEKLFGKQGLIFALTIGSIVFGFGHLYQGFGGMIQAVIRGLLYASVYLRKRRAFESVSAHATYDIISMTLGFVLYSG